RHLLEGDPDAQPVERAAGIPEGTREDLQAVLPPPESAGPGGSLVSLLVEEPFELRRQGGQRRRVARPQDVEVGVDAGRQTPPAPLEARTDERGELSEHDEADQEETAERDENRPPTPVDPQGQPDDTRARGAPAVPA